MKRETPIPEFKKETVKSLTDLIKNKKTILIASIKNLPASQFQEISKKIRGKAIVKVPKKNLIFRAVDSSKNENLKKLKDQIEDSVAILFSDLDSYDLASELLKSKSPAKAKAGQEAPEDIEVQAGPTDLVPGPAISELGSLGIQIEIKEGKINIKEPRIIAKKGAKISQNAADVMSKLDIKPFSVGFIPLSGFDIREGILYLNIEIDPEGTLKKLKQAYGKALPFAVEIGYATEDTIKFLISKAGMHEKVLKKFVEENDVSKEKNGNEEKIKDKKESEKIDTSENKTEEESK
ncbi:MAG: 50S ribosomal protein L10 [archaeon]